MFSWLLGLFIILVSLLVQPVNDDYPYKEGVLCEPIHTLVGGEPLSWVGYDNGAWEGWPADIKATNYINFADGHGGVLDYRAESVPGVHWVIVFVSYEANADANGEHMGNHAFCGPYRIESDW